MACSLIDYDNIKLNDTDDKVIDFPVLSCRESKQNKTVKNGDEFYKPGEQVYTQGEGARKVHPKADI